MQYRPPEISQRLAQEAQHSVIMVSHLITKIVEEREAIKPVDDLWFDIQNSPQLTTVKACADSNVADYPEFQSWVEGQRQVTPAHKKGCPGNPSVPLKISADLPTPKACKIKRPPSILPYSPASFSPSSNRLPATVLRPQDRRLFFARHSIQAPKFHPILFIKSALFFDPKTHR